jgi:hypothetical protein
MKDPGLGLPAGHEHTPYCLCSEERKRAIDAARQARLDWLDAIILRAFRAP